MLGISEETALVNALFAAASGADGADGAAWEAFLDRLCVATHADGAGLQLGATASGAANWRVGKIVMPDPDRLRAMRRDRVYSQIDLPGAESWPDPLRALKVHEGEAGQAVLAISRPLRDFRAAEALHLTHLAPHLGQAARIWTQLGGERSRAARHLGAAAALGAGWIVLGPTGAVLDLDPQVARRLEAEGWIRFRIGARPEFAEADAALAFRQALAGLAAGGEAGRPIELSDDPPAHLWMQPGEWHGAPALIGHLRQAPVARAVSVERVAAHLDLSRSEARLAMHLCDGLSLREAADQLGWTLETARSVSKRIFARAGVNGQTGLLRKMLTGTLWFG